MQTEIIEAIEGAAGEKIEHIPYGSGIVELKSGRKLYLKTGAVSDSWFCEANSLGELREAGVDVPQVVAVGNEFIATAYVEPGRAGSDFYHRLARMVALMHRCEGDGFGYVEDNFIGATPQPNVAIGREVTRWADFFFNKRILFQLDIARERGYRSVAAMADDKRFRDACYDLLGGIDEPPSLLHGDLWSGNYLCDREGRPWLIDPAVYYGHRESDLAMTRMFGGFPPEFYEAYDREYPLERGWRERTPLYQLYHALNHLNMFGGSYLPQTESLVRQVLGRG